MAEGRRTWPYLLGGIVVGTALGVLFARKPGKELREDIEDWMKENREKSRGLLAGLKERLPAKKEQVIAAFKAGKEAFKEADHHHRKELIDA